MNSDDYGIQLLQERVYYFSAKYSQKGRYQILWKQLRERALERLRAQIELYEREELREF
jgi:hypothetical protein